MGSQGLITTGFVGMLTLGATGFLTWWWYAGGPQKLWSNTKALFGKITGRSQEEKNSSLSSDSTIRTCSQLFAM